MQNNELFLKNTQALFEVDQVLAYELRSLHACQRFGLDENLNIFDKKTQSFVYQDMSKDIQENYLFFKQNYEKYPVLFFYGFGNGMLIKLLLENDKHKHIIIFEPELEILYLAFHLFDFTHNLSKERLIIFYTKSLNSAQLNTLFQYKDIATSVKTYNFNLQSEFYNKAYFDELNQINAQIIHEIKYSVLGKGNDPVDSIVGIKQALQNLPTMLAHGVFQDFLKQRKGKVKNAIIVATGPSLAKQLPLLKEYQDRATIFCADSSYEILYKHNIKPDYVLSLERIDFSSEFFNNDFGEFDKGILFIVSSLVHENTLSYFEKTHRDFMLVLRPLPFSLQLELPKFGYLGTGHSVANMAYELAGALRHENIILIGQDLAYGKDGVSHTDDFRYLEDHKQDYEKHKGRFTTVAYGGEGFVESSDVWTLFRQSFERDINIVKNMLKINTYNCTEGGARIGGTLEKPFKEVCESLLVQKIDKFLYQAPTLNEHQRNKELKKIKQKLENNVKKLKKFSQDCLKELDKVAKLLEVSNVEDFDIKEALKSKQALMILKEKLRAKNLHSEALATPLFHNDCELVRIETMSSGSQQEQVQQLITWLDTQQHWFHDILLYTNAQQKAIEESIEKW
ncbi:motility accessory factor [Campylobacter sp. MIT 99-7217]|uniref:motility associated factor glycosyltransferase family protein n=1 Tax=Campylobacter sp. MIT 99-7217 TaxID=535091 RepID=UPI00115A31E8|nr:motility associated factor glycosyltransferase family protein [Campylobacter sp. MIT 99-7217]TQR33812.1 motility accessory factor [Campylobacter sp. MIT 99-7217]